MESFGEWLIFAAILILSHTISKKSIPNLENNFLSLEKLLVRLFTGKRQNGTVVNLVDAVLEVANAINNYIFYISTTGKK